MQPKTPETYLALYQKLHDAEDGFIIDGKEFPPNKKLFDGDNFTKKLVGAFDRTLRVKNKAVRVLDYGCGKAEHLFKPTVKGKTIHQAYPGLIQTYYCFDPGYKKFSTPPEEGAKFDIVICADVMEHVPHSHVYTTLAKINSYLADDGVALFTISAQKAKKHFLDGENLHCTVMPTEQWVKEMKAVFKFDKGVYMLCETRDKSDVWFNEPFRRIKNAVV